MLSKIAVVSMLAGASLASPAPFVTTPVPDHVKLHHTKPVNGGNFMPGHTSAVERRDTGEWVNNANIATWNSNVIQDGVGDGVDSYTMYWGSGSTADGWPDKSRWVSFENMFNNYKNQMFQSCGWENPPQPNNSGPEVGAIWDGIQKAAAATGVDHRFILAVLMQESGGCVRVHTTNYGVRNPGLMQDHNGDATCNENGWVQNPCPNDTIYKMISEGVAGTASGDGLANCLNQAGTNDVSAFYRAARIYNSGSISSTGALQNNIATHCYSSDIANRLTGWVNAASKCNCDNDPNSCGIVNY